MINKPRVFVAVTLEATANAANLPLFGNIVYLYASVPNIWTPSIEGDLIARFDDLNFNPDLDFFAVSGTIPLSCIALATLVEEFGEIRTLLWDREKHGYREKEIGNW